MSLVLSDKLELVPISLKYASEVHENFTEDIIRFLPIDNISDNLEDTITFIERSMKQRKNGTDLVWVILYENQFVGCCGIHTIQSNQPHFGIWIRKEQQGKGIGKSVVRFVLNWGISNLEVEFIKYPVDKRNTRSVELIKGLGLKCFDHYQLGKQKKLETDEYRIY